MIFCTQAPLMSFILGFAWQKRIPLYLGFFVNSFAWLLKQPAVLSLLVIQYLTSNSSNHLSDIRVKTNMRGDSVGRWPVISLQFEERIPQISQIVPAANTLRLYASTGSFTGRQLDGANLVRSEEKIVLFDLLTANNLLVSLLTAAPIIASLLNHKSGVN